MRIDANKYKPCWGNIQWSIKFDGCSSQQHGFSMDFGYISQGGVEVQVVVGMLY